MFSTVNAILARCHQRIPLTGDFTDYLLFNRFNDGQTVSLAINQLVRARIKREKDRELHVFTDCDLPSANDLGIRGAQLVAIISSLFKFHGQRKCHKQVALIAAELETTFFPTGAGKMDTFICKNVGVSKVTYRRKGLVRCKHLELSQEAMANIETKLILFDTGIREKVLKLNTRFFYDSDNREIIAEGARLSVKLSGALENGQYTPAIPEALNAQDAIIKRLLPNMREGWIDRAMDKARAIGAGVRLSGVGSGYLICFAEWKHHQLLRDTLGLPQVPVEVLW
jgi:galactokinase/mevalonate kinase-like predicted kinase